MIKQIQKFIDKLNKNPYDEVVKSQQDILERNPNTPQLAKLAWFCNCEVEDIVNELKSVLYDVR